MSASERHVAIYCRISPRPDGQSEGVDVQERRGRKYAGRAWPGVPVVVYADRSLSAADDTWRPEFEKFRTAVRDGQVAHVWAVEQSRLQRREAGWFELAAELDDAGIPEIHTDRDGVVRVRDEVAGIKAVLAASEVRKMKRRVNDRLDDNAAQGRPAGSTPFGYRHAGDTYVIVAWQADAIRWAADRVLSGWSLASVESALRARGVFGGHRIKVRDSRGEVVTDLFGMTDSRTGHVVTDGIGWPVTRPGRITAGSVRSWLTNPTVAGKRVHRGEIVGDGNWPPILDEATWMACRARLAAPRTVIRSDGGTYPVGPAQRGYSGRKYLLTGGLLACGVCHAPMVGSVKQLKGGAARGGRDVAYYLCHPSRGGRACTGIMLEATEAEVLARLFAELDKPEFLDRVAEDGHAARRAEITTALAALDAKRADLARLWAAPGGLTNAEWQEARAALDAAERDLRAELAGKAAPPARVTIEDARSAWPDMTLGERREFVRLFIDRVTITPARPGLQRFDPDRVHVDWRAA